jgi:hypothetical protein
MSDLTTLPLQAHVDRLAFREHAWNIGRAYRNQAMELISICQLLSLLAPPKLEHEYLELRRYELTALESWNPSCIFSSSLTFSCRIRRVCDLALHSASASGTRVTDDANARFKEATDMLNDYSERRKHL